MRINPDTAFTGADLEHYLKLFKGLRSRAERDRYMKSEAKAAVRDAKARARQAKRDAKEAARLLRRREKEMADSIRVVRRDSMRQAGKERIMTGRP